MFNLTWFLILSRESQVTLVLHVIGHRAQHGIGHVHFLDDTLAAKCCRYLC